MPSRRNPGATNDVIARGYPDRVVVAITGAIGTVFGIRLLERLHEFDVERHLIISSWGARTIRHETDFTVKRVREMADVTYKVGDSERPYQAARSSREE